MCAWLIENDEIIRNFSVALSALIAALAFTFNAWEKSKENRLNRFETYLNFEKRLNSETSFQKLITMLEEDHPELEKLNTLEKYKYLGFLEEIAIAVDNNLLSKKLAFYMFGYYAIQAQQSQYFNKLQDGEEINWDSVYWRVLKKFVIDMKKIQTRNADKPSLGKIRV